MRSMGRGWLATAGVVVIVGGMAALIAGPVSAGVLTSRDVRRIANQLDAKVAGRVAFATNTEPGRTLDPGQTGGSITQLTTPITLPAAGFLVIEGSIESYSIEVGGFVSNENFRCLIEVDNVAVGSSVRWVRLDGWDLGPQSGIVINDEENCDTDAVVPAAAGTHTVELVTEFVNFNNAVTDAMTLSALYVPYNGTGVRPTSFGIVRPASRSHDQGDERRAIPTR